MPQVVAGGGLIQVSAEATDPDGDTLTYAWTASKGWTVKAGGDGAAVVQAPATGGVQGLVTVTVTDGHGGTAKASVGVATEPVPPAPPSVTANIAGTAPLSAVMNTELTLDGSGSTAPAGDPLTYAWAVTDGPAGAGATVKAMGATAKATFVTDTAGTYTVALTVTDPAGLTDMTTTTVSVAGPSKLTIASGNNQSGTVYTDLAKPLVVQAMTSGGKPVPGIEVDFAPAGGTLETQATTSTDASGNAEAVVKLSRIAGSGSVTASVPGMATLTASFDFTATAGPVRTINVSMTTGNADTGATVSVSPVDQYGNPSTTDSVANAQVFQLTASGSATFASTATAGTLDSGGGTNQIQGELASGVFTIALTDTTAEAVTVQIQSVPTTGLTLPYSAWAEDFEDDAEVGMGAWKTAETSAPTWQVEGGASVSHGGSQAFGADVTPAGTALTGESVMAYQDTSGAGATAKLEYWQSLKVSSATDAANGCTAQPDFFLAARPCEDLGCQAMSLAPRSGYPVTDACSGRPGFATTSATSGWEAQEVDVTDALAAGDAYLDFEMANTPDAATPAKASDWHVDDVRIVHLTSPGSSATANTIIRPGAPAEVDWTAASYDSVVFGACPNGYVDIPVEADIVDANGNVTRDSQLVFDLGWTAHATAIQATAGTVVSVGATDAEMRFEGGRAGLALHDPNTEAVALSLTDTRGTGLTPGPSATANFAPLTSCHDDGVNERWSDDVALGTYNKTQAIRACEAHYGAGSCGADAQNAYPVIVTCPPVYEWTYVSGYSLAMCNAPPPPPLLAGMASRGGWADSPGQCPSNACVAPKAYFTGVFAFPMPWR